MKVIHVINTLGGSGGAEHGLVREITRFSPDVEQVVVRLFAKDQIGYLLEDAGIEVIGLGLDSGRAGRNWPLAIAKLDSVVRSEKPDVVHSSLFASNLVAQLESRLRHIPVLSTFTLSGRPDLLARYQPGAGSRRAAALRRLAGHAAKGGGVWFRALTQDALSTNCDLLGIDPARAEVIPRGIPADLEPSPLMSREDLGLPSSGDLLVNVGRQTAQKGHLSLLEAFEQVRREHDCHLVVVGREGDATATLRSSVADSGLADHVTLTGYTAHVYHYLSHASVFVFSSYMEGLGTAVLEALALGKRVVAYDIAPVREVTDDGALADLVPVGDSSALAGAVVKVLGGPDTGALQRQELVLRRFSIDSIAQRLEELLVRTASR